jgi:ATP-binding cassette subfamily C (CFTR/MRP) protein 1
VQSLLIADKQAIELTTENLAEGQDTTKATPAKEFDQQKDLTRRTGDVQVYKYYFKSIGWRHITALFALMVVAEFCLYFPRKQNPSSFLSFLGSSLQDAELWVKWWAEADTNNPRHQTALYYGVYIMLGVVGLCFAAGSVLWVSAPSRSNH